MSSKKNIARSLDCEKSFAFIVYGKCLVKAFDFAFCVVELFSLSKLGLSINIA
jgi:hypothetical protein